MADKERVEWWFSALCAIPWLALAGPYIEACIVRLVLSRWPRPMVDDLQLNLLDLLIWTFLISSVIAVPLLTFSAALKWRKVLSNWRYTVHIGVAAVGLVALVLLFHYDPGRVWDWFLD
jgi:hypothetical protein